MLLHASLRSAASAIKLIAVFCWSRPHLTCFMDVRRAIEPRPIARPLLPLLLSQAVMRAAREAWQADVRNTQISHFHLQVQP